MDFCRIRVLIVLSLLSFGIAFGQSNEQKELFYLYDSLGNAYLDSNSDSALKYTLKILEVVEKTGSDKQKMAAYALAGNTYTKLYEFNTSLAYFLKALELIHKRGSKNEAVIMGNIGNLYIMQERYSDAYKWYIKSYDKAIIENNYEMQVLALSSMCDYFNANGLPDSSIAKLDQALNIAHVRVRERLGVVFDNIANAYFSKAVKTGDQSHYKTVLAYADSALKIHLRDQDSVSIAYIYGMLGATNMNLKNYTASETYYTLFQELNKRLNDIFGLRLGYDEMSSMYASQHQFEKAYMSRLKYDSINKQYLNELSTKQVQELDKKYQTEKKEQENQLLMTKNNLSEEVIKRQKTTVILVIGGLIALMIALIFIFRSLRMQKKANYIIQQQKEEVEIQKDLVEEKNKEITDSIHYARRIQRSLLPSEKFFEKEMKKSQSTFEKST